MKICLGFECEDYLAQWYIHKCGGESPVRLVRGTPEFLVLRFSLRPKREAEVVHRVDGCPLIIQIPNYRGMNIETYNYLPDRCREAFLKILKERFDIDLWRDLYEIWELGVGKSESIYAWMISNGIDPSEKNWNAVSKRLSRMRARLLTKYRVRRHRNKLT